ncbi:hypothetical protein Dsin_018534 [Dipteronia sinensis]|uniref:Isoleucyl-tRNA synthetase n=1 Tax=Dipteronia sinensis TaxID=43782 RepID=A0AAE0A714_9ROSI|nr:hypothetical protein Dsin_018534 [Dipteronia sinensis]
MEIQRLTARFWWGSNSNCRKIHWSTWSRLCRPKQEGDLGFRDLETFNRSLLAKQCWRVIKTTNSLASRVHKGCYFSNHNLIEMPKKVAGSFIWHCLVWAKGILDLGMRKRVGSGASIRIYKDNLVPGSSSLGIRLSITLGLDATVDCLLLDSGVINQYSNCALPFYSPNRFVRVETLKEKLLENNKQTYWVPDYVKEKRFHNWLENARDWAVSRSRFWGTPLPVWISEDGEEVIVMDSVDKLEKLAGVEVFDLHRHNIDHITIPSSRGPEFSVLRRVEDVFDCWFESGSMPYAYIHYPFENAELFEKNFPGHFVAEGLDQTRGWFYTLMVLSTALFGKPAFRNLICNGLVLAEDGKKMSKKLKNYPSPVEVINDYGADALRLYLINSPVVRAETVRFKKEGVYGVVKDVFLPWYNAYRFLVQNAKRLEIEGGAPFTPIDLATLQKSSKVLDQWINSATQSLVHFVGQEMDGYRLYTVVPYLLKFLDNLTNIYVRFNRKRLKGRTREDDCRTALSTLYNVLLTSCKVMAPFTPFFTEVLYQNMRKVCNGSEESIHFCSFPQEEGERDERIEQSVAKMMTIIDLARNIRERHNKPLKSPLRGASNSSCISSLSITTSFTSFSLLLLFLSFSLVLSLKLQGDDSCSS